MSAFSPFASSLALLVGRSQVTVLACGAPDNLMEPTTHGAVADARAFVACQQVDSFRTTTLREESHNG